MIYSIHILRGLAALLVVLYHFSPVLKSVAPSLDFEVLLFGRGYVGVDIFFIISGFIIVRSTDQGAYSNSADFLIRRFFRVVPLAQICTLIYFFMLGPDRPSSEVFWRSLFFLPRADFDPPKFGFPVLRQEWTLSYELIFYAVFGFILLFTHRRRVLVAIVVILAFIVGFQSMLGGTISFSPDGIYLPVPHPAIIAPEFLGQLGNPIMLEFILGMVLAAAYLRFQDTLRSPQWTSIERLLGFILIGCFLVSYFSAMNPGHGLFRKGFGGACLVVGALLFEVSFPPLSVASFTGVFPAFFLWLGTISYPLYLVHYGISQKLLLWFSETIHMPDIVDGFSGFILLILLSLVLASLVHIYVERRLATIGRKLIEHRKKSEALL